MRSQIVDSGDMTTCTGLRLPWIVTFSNNFISLAIGGCPSISVDPTTNTQVNGVLGFFFFFKSEGKCLCKSRGASTISGFFAAACSLPFDYVKTQIQKMPPDAEGKLPYSGSLDCALKTLKSGGPFKFYTGFPVYCVRIAPHVMMTWIFLNQIQKLEKSVGL
ncbi:mitochondrial dicarboxylate/tricarboxylate transporter dtc [Quercus suber]|uniref:Mitochondrial dicarboxylate/tricarboxylate transporter dtc n=1 Tax=Quercus suber TaxID=58331 RepID=A0AAW0JB15_QUESU